MKQKKEPNKLIVQTETFLCFDDQLPDFEILKSSDDDENEYFDKLDCNNETVRIEDKSNEEYIKNYSFIKKKKYIESNVWYEELKEEKYLSE